MVEITGMGLTLAPAVVAGSFCLNAAFAVQTVQTRVEGGDAVVKIRQQQIERMPL
jgi:hypothetical protein